MKQMAITLLLALYVVSSEELKSDSHGCCTANLAFSTTFDFCRGLKTEADCYTGPKAGLDCKWVDCAEVGYCHDDRRRRMAEEEDFVSDNIDLEADHHRAGHNNNRPSRTPRPRPSKSPKPARTRRPRTKPTRLKGCAAITEKQGCIDDKGCEWTDGYPPEGMEYDESELEEEEIESEFFDFVDGTHMRVNIGYNNNMMILSGFVLIALAVLLYAYKTFSQRKGAKYVSFASETAAYGSIEA